MSIVSSEAKYGAGKKSVKYVFTEDNTDVHYTPSKRIADGFDVAKDMEVRRLRKERALILEEISRFLSKLDENSTPTHQTQNELRRDVLIKILKDDGLSNVLPHLKSVSFLSKITDSQLKTLLSIDDSQVAQIRVWQAEMMTVWQINKNYEAIL